ncbi:MAG: Trk system potassium transporter TrkA [Lachnospiraceae bacterium]|nr:Trk system potassium transporter TrkA [Lachnospiraceae bacterium]MDY5741458.1 Trk system potassium transporter TrkA [Lachnospiraceae bacterium]
MRIVIIGCGKVGQILAENLSREEHEITLIESNERVLEHASETYDVWGVVGNGASRKIQLEAGINEADLTIAVTRSDEVNVLSCLIAKKNGCKNTIARVRNPELIDGIASIKKELGISMMINPDMASANEVLRQITLPHSVKADVFAKGRIDLLQFKIQPGSILDGLALTEIRRVVKTDCIVCTIVREDEVIIPDGRVVLRADDNIGILVSRQTAYEFFKSIHMEMSRIREVMIIGASKQAYYLAKGLLQLKKRVRILEINKERCEEFSELLEDAIIIHGDATDHNVLLEEGLPDMDAVINLTNIDEENVMLALFEKKYSHANLFTKVNRMTSESVVKDLDIGNIVFPKYITVNVILRYVRAMENSIGHSNIETLHRILDNRVEALEFYIDEETEATGRKLTDMKTKGHTLVACIYRDGRVIIPTGQDEIRMGDNVIVISSRAGLGCLEDILER